VFDVHRPFVGVFGPGQIRGLRGCVKRYVDVTYLRGRKSGETVAVSRVVPPEYSIDSGRFKYF
jgi:hypothetical protein